MFEPLGKFLVVAGLVLAAAGLVLYVGGKIPFLGHLPGDIVIRRERWTLHFPLTTCLVVSILLTLLFSLFSRR
jgi:hypothetical protein